MEGGKKLFKTHLIYEKVLKGRKLQSLPEGKTIKAQRAHTRSSFHPRIRFSENCTLSIDKAKELCSRLFRGGPSGEGQVSHSPVCRMLKQAATYVTTDPRRTRAEPARDAAPCPGSAVTHISVLRGDLALFIRIVHGSQKARERRLRTPAPTERRGWLWL